MRLPYLQLEADFVTSKAALVAARAGISEILALGMGAKLFAFAVTETGDADNAPDGVFVDPDASDVLEHLLGWEGERGRLITAFERAGVIERLDVGLRVRGLDRYRRTWEKNTRKPVSGASGAGKVPETGTNPAGKAPLPARQTQTQTQTQKKQKQPPTAAPVENTEAFGWLTWADAARTKALPQALQDPPGDPGRFLAWWRDARGQVDAPRLRAAYEAFLADAYPRGLKPPCPWAAWAKGWRRYVPGQQAPPTQEFREVQPGEDLYAEGAA